MPENWTELHEGYELTMITKSDGTHPKPLCGHAENIPGIGWNSDCRERATHGYRNPVRRSATTHFYDEYACAAHLAEMAATIDAQLAEMGA